MANFKTVSDFLREASTSGGLSYIGVEATPVPGSRSEAAMSEMVREIDSAFSRLCGEMSFNLQTTFSTICEFDSLDAAHAYMTRIAEVITRLKTVVMKATIYHDGREIDCISTVQEITARH